MGAEGGEGTEARAEEAADLIEPSADLAAPLASPTASLAVERAEEATSSAVACAEAKRGDGIRRPRVAVRVVRRAIIVMIALSEVDEENEGKIVVAESTDRRMFQEVLLTCFFLR